jgi:hypothetical protein
MVLFNISSINREPAQYELQDMASKEATQETKTTSNKEAKVQTFASALFKAFKNVFNKNQKEFPNKAPQNSFIEVAAIQAQMQKLQAPDAAVRLQVMIDERLAKDTCINFIKPEDKNDSTAVSRLFLSQLFHTNSSILDCTKFLIQMPERVFVFENHSEFLDKNFKELANHYKTEDKDKLLEFVAKERSFAIAKNLQKIFGKEWGKIAQVALTQIIPNFILREFQAEISRGMKGYQEEKGSSFPYQLNGKYAICLVPIYDTTGNILRLDVRVDSKFDYLDPKNNNKEVSTMTLGGGCTLKKNEMNLPIVENVGTFPATFKACSPALSNKGFIIYSSKDMVQTVFKKE